MDHSSTSSKKSDEFEVVKSLTVPISGKDIRVDVRKYAHLRDDVSYYAVSEYVPHSGDGEPYKPYPYGGSPEEVVEVLVALLKSAQKSDMGDKQWVPNPLWK